MTMNKIFGGFVLALTLTFGFGNVAMANTPDISDLQRQADELVRAQKTQDELVQQGMAIIKAQEAEDRRKAAAAAEEKRLEAERKAAEEQKRLDALAEKLRLEAEENARKEQEALIAQAKADADERTRIDLEVAARRVEQRQAELNRQQLGQ